MLKNMKTLMIAGLATVAMNAGYVQADEKPELVVYTYESFVGEWGPAQA